SPFRYGIERSERGTLLEVDCRARGHMRTSPATPPIWTPSADRVARANLTRFMREHASHASTYAVLYEWSVANPVDFWAAGWRLGGVVAGASTGLPWDQVLVGGDHMRSPDPTRGPCWFPGARLNFAENLLRFRDDRAALVFWNELGRQRELSF